nr:TIGR04282 family arsenosugar biosynthesis glycosyltransferase [Gramella oceanisediminis]
MIIFTKNPERGKVKTRLAKDIGDQKALEIYKFLLEHSRKVTSKLAVDKQVWYSNKISENDIWDNELFSKRLQEGSDLGERMELAFKKGFAEGYKQIVIIGTDLFDLKTSDLEMAFSALDDHDYVIGPAKDGGYYLFGMNSLNSKVFRKKNWSTSTVLDDTLEDLLNFKLKILRTQNDIDVLDDLNDHSALKRLIES